MSSLEKKRRIILQALLGAYLLMIIPRLDVYLSNWQSRVIAQEANPSPEVSSVCWKTVRGEMVKSTWARVLASRRDILLTPAQLRPIVEEAHTQAAVSGVRLSRILALIVVESGGKKRIVSPAGARGLMQLIPDTGHFVAMRLGEKIRAEDLFDPRINVRYGTWYYRYLIEYFDGNEKAATAAYNWGPGTIEMRLTNGEKLPEIYPGKVDALEKWLMKEFKDDYSSRFWENITAAEHRQRSGGDPERQYVGRDRGLPT